MEHQKPIIKTDDFETHGIRLLQPDGAMFVLHGPVRFVVRNGNLVNVDPLMFDLITPPSSSDASSTTV